MTQNNVLDGLSKEQLLSIVFVLMMYAVRLHERVMELEPNYKEKQ